MNKIPCHFLHENKCTVYEARPTECREFPGLHKPGFIKRSFATFMHYGRCPIIFNVIEALKKELNVTHLCDIDLKTFEDHRHLINDPILDKRALHVISENFRVGEAKDALKANDLATFGKLMYASHQSLKDWYEVSGKELDIIVEFCKTYEDCIGARMTGAGFGGCAIALVKKNKFEDFSSKINAYYEDKIGYKPDVFASEIGDGVGELKKEFT